MRKGGSSAPRIRQSLSVSAYGDLGAKTLARDVLKCPTECKLSSVLGRCLTSNQDSTPLLADDQPSDATVGRLADLRLDLFDEGFHCHCPLT